MNDFFDSKIVENLKDCEKHGVNISKLPIGTKIQVLTKNSVYEIEYLGENRILIDGGKYFCNEEAVLHGSTWGGAMIKNSWIGIDMKMEIHRENQICVTTSSVQKIKIFGENWVYELSEGNAQLD